MSPHILGCRCCGKACDLDSCDRSCEEFSNSEVTTSTQTSYTGTIPGTFTATSAEDSIFGLPAHSRKITFNIDATAGQRGTLSHVIVVSDDWSPLTDGEIGTVSMCVNVKCGTATISVGGVDQDPRDYRLKVALAVVQSGNTFLGFLGRCVEQFWMETV